MISHLLRNSLHLVLTLALIAKGQEKQTGIDAKNTQSVESGDSSLQLPPSKAVEDGVYLETLKKKKSVNELFQKKNFDKIDEMATRYRKERTVYKNGHPKLAVVYEAFELNRDRPTEEWLQQKTLLEEWGAAHPSSLTARIALGQFWIDYAWRARGSGFANTVKEEGWEQFKDRLQEAKKVLAEAREELNEKDPFMFCLLMSVALGEGADRKVADGLLEEGLEIDPTFWLLDSRRVIGLLPRWGAADGEWQEFAMQAADRSEGLGDEVYFRILRHVSRFEKDCFKDKGVSWSKFKDGIQASRKKYPDSLEILCAAAGFALKAGDRAAAKEYFEALNGRYIPRMWVNEKIYEGHRKWAYIPDYPSPIAKP